MKFKKEGNIFVYRIGKYTIKANLLAGELPVISFRVEDQFSRVVVHNSFWSHMFPGEIGNVIVAATLTEDPVYVSNVYDLLHLDKVWNLPSNNRFLVECAYYKDITTHTQFIWNDSLCVKLDQLPQCSGRISLDAICIVDSNVIMNKSSVSGANRSSHLVPNRSNDPCVGFWFVLSSKEPFFKEEKCFTYMIPPHGSTELEIIGADMSQMQTWFTKKIEMNVVLKSLGVQPSYHLKQCSVARFGPGNNHRLRFEVSEESDENTGDKHERSNI